MAHGQELLAFDYDATFEDRRVSGEILPGVISHGMSCPPGQGTVVTFREFLGQQYFTDLNKLKALGPETRILFYFD